MIRSLRELWRFSRCLGWTRRAVVSTWWRAERESRRLERLARSDLPLEALPLGALAKRYPSD